MNRSQEYRSLSTDQACSSGSLKQRPASLQGQKEKCPINGTRGMPGVRSPHWNVTFSRAELGSVHL